MAYSVNRLPRKDHWIQVCAKDPPVHFRQSLDVAEEGEGQGRVCVRTFVFELRARGPKAQKKAGLASRSAAGCGESLKHIRGFRKSTTKPDCFLKSWMKFQLNSCGSVNFYHFYLTSYFALRDHGRGVALCHQVDQFIDDAFEFYKLKKGEETDKSIAAAG
eukprot:Skav212864  [mRNA]  locus=scaffold151:8913:9395:- [translate_table: standard]